MYFLGEHFLQLFLADAGRLGTARQGTNVVGTNGGTANFMVFGQGDFLGTPVNFSFTARARVYVCTRARITCTVIS